MPNPVGRPLKFKTVEELQKGIDSYFESTPIEDWTITGLAIHLGTYRDVLIDYKNKDEFSNSLKAATQKVEHSYELDLKHQGRAGTIFALKNFKWKDTQTHEGQSFTVVLDNKESKV